MVFTRTYDPFFVFICKEDIPVVTPVVVAVGVEVLGGIAVTMVTYVCGEVTEAP